MLRVKSFGTTCRGDVERNTSNIHRCPAPPLEGFNGWRRRKAIFYKSRENKYARDEKIKQTNTKTVCAWVWLRFRSAIVSYHASFLINPKIGQKTAARHKAMLTLSGAQNKSSLIFFCWVSCVFFFFSWLVWLLSSRGAVRKWSSRGWNCRGVNAKSCLEINANFQNSRRNNARAGVRKKWKRVLYKAKNKAEYFVRMGERKLLSAFGA